MDTSKGSLVVLGLSITVLLAACGGAPAQTSAPSGPRATAGVPATRVPDSETANACALLTAADIQAVTGFEAKASVAGPQAGIFPNGCQWELIDAEAIVPPSISLGVMTPGGRAYYDTHFAPFNAENGYEAIQGLGDEAYDSDAGSVIVVSGDTFLQVQYLGGGFGGDDTAVAADLAGKVVANLGR